MYAPMWDELEDNETHHFTLLQRATERSLELAAEMSRLMGCIDLIMSNRDLMTPPKQFVNAHSEQVVQEIKHCVRLIAHKRQEGSFQKILYDEKISLNSKIHLLEFIFVRYYFCEFVLDIIFTSFFYKYSVMCKF